jgi:hypothetical protein
MYRGPNAKRVGRQFDEIQGWAGEQATWRQWVSASSGLTTAYFAGGGNTDYYREQVITALFAAPQMGESRYRETQMAAGEIIAGDAVVSTDQPMNSRDEIIWRGVTYRIAGDNTPINFANRTWYRTLIRRGDVTG